MLLQAVKANLDEDARQVLADAGLRPEAVFEQRKGSPSALIMAWGREGRQGLQTDAQRRPRRDGCEAGRTTASGSRRGSKNRLGCRHVLEKVKAECKLLCLAPTLRRMTDLRARGGLKRQAPARLACGTLTEAVQEASTGQPPGARRPASQNGGPPKRLVPQALSGAALR